MWSHIGKLIVAFCLVDIICGVENESRKDHPDDVKDSTMYRALQELLEAKFKDVESQINMKINILEEKLNQCQLEQKNELKKLAEQIAVLASDVGKNSERTEDILGNIAVSISEMHKDVKDTDITRKCHNAAPSNTELEQLQHSNHPDEESIHSSTTDNAVESITPESRIFRNCAEARTAGNVISGVYTLQLHDGYQFKAYCDMKTDGGGWTVLQRRTSGQLYFNRYWSDFKKGFGNMTDDHWLGLDKIHMLTAAERTSLRVEIGRVDGNGTSALYSRFYVGGEDDKYRLLVEGYSGDDDDGLTLHSGWAFSTRDRDNDGVPGNLAELYTGAWWYQSYFYNSNLNGPLDGIGGHVVWNNHKTAWYRKSQVSTTEMKVRPNSFHVDTN